jgi:hypothetical protein
MFRPFRHVPWKFSFFAFLTNYLAKLETTALCVSLSIFCRNRRNHGTKGKGYSRRLGGSDRLPFSQEIDTGLVYWLIASGLFDAKGRPTQAWRNAWDKARCLASLA